MNERTPEQLARLAAGGFIDTLDRYLEVELDQRSENYDSEYDMRTRVSREDLVDAFTEAVLALSRIASNTSAVGGQNHRTIQAGDRFQPAQPPLPKDVVFVAAEKIPAGGTAFICMRCSWAWSTEAGINHHQEVQHHYGQSVVLPVE